jgi:carboxyl-terminal processing protease
VRSVVPGGPAALSGKIQPGDRIVAVGQGKQGPLTEIIGWRVDDVVELVRGPKDSWVRLDLLPADAGIDGEHVVVAINRQKIKLEEQAAKQRVIEVPDGDTVRRVGVISLPGFYEDFEGRRRDEPDYRSATRDVAKLLVELKEENVEGVVLDLRNNGGGSLGEAVELTGLFIDTGPVVQVRYSNGRVQIESDRKPGTVWDGPLAVLVNRASASASEIVAAAIQDHGRGLIIGETTFGKGTVQNLLDLDNLTRARESAGLGQLKLTVAQFFRISGGSTQLKGVVPDIAFPVTLDAEDYGESSYDNALPWTSIAAVPHDQLADFQALTPLLTSRHQLRSEKDPELRWLKEDIARYREQRDRKTLSLNFESRRAERDELTARRKSRDAERKALGEAVEENALLDDGLQANERDLKEQLKREKAGDDDKPDALLREAVNVLVDAIDLLKSDGKLAAQVYPEKAAQPD